MKRAVFSIILAATMACAWGQTDTTARYTVGQCVDMALQNSRAAANAQRQVDAAVSLRREAFTKYFPEIAATGMVFWANHEILQYNLLNIIELGIIKNGKGAGVQALQPIFTGGQIVNGNNLAALGEEVARLRQTQTDNELRLTTETLFWKLATLEATRLTLDAAVATVDSISAQVQAAVDAGIATHNDLLRVKIKLNTYRSEAVDLDNGIALVRMLLGQYMGLGTDGTVQIAADVPADVPDIPYHLYITPADALYSTVDYQLLGKNVRAKQLEKRMEIGKYLPTVAVGAGWYYHDLLKQNHNFGAVQIAVAVPISGWWGGAHAIKRKAIALEIAQNERDDLGEKIQIQIQDKWNSLTAAQRKMQIEAEGIQQSQENYRLNSMYYQAGISTVADLLEAETALKDAREKYITAYGAYRTATAAYLIASGR